MDEQISSLQRQYRDYHSNDGTGITVESLVENSREFLTTVKPEDRFAHQNMNFYKDVLETIAQKFERNEDCIKIIKAGMNSLEKYGVNLWRFPWRKEYHTVKVACVVRWFYLYEFALLSTNGYRCTLFFSTINLVIHNLAMTSWLLHVPKIVFHDSECGADVALYWCKSFFCFVDFVLHKLAFVQLELGPLRYVFLFKIQQYF